MPTFTRGPEATETILTDATGLPEVPFVVELSSEGANARRFRVLAVEKRGEMLALLLRCRFKVPLEGELRVVPTKRILLEKVAAGFAAAVEGGGARMTGQDLEMGLHLAFLLADVYGGGDPEPGPHVSIGAIAEAKRTWEHFERYRAKRPAS